MNTYIAKITIKPKEKTKSELYFSAHIDNEAFKRMLEYINNIYNHMGVGESHILDQNIAYEEYYNATVTDIINRWVRGTE